MATLTDKDGLDISLSRAQGSTLYTSLGWLGTKWLFTEGSFPSPNLPPLVDYPKGGPIDYSEFERQDAFKNGILKSYDSFLGTALYSTFTSSYWQFSSTGLPIVTNSPLVKYPIPEIDYTPWREIELQLNGTSISKKNSMKATSYTSAGWSIPTVWNMKDDSMLPEPVLSPLVQYEKGGPIDYSEFIILDFQKNGSFIPYDKTLLQDTYGNLSWDFNKVWGIREFLTLPRPLRWQKHTPSSDPMSSSAWEVLLKPHEDGTLSYDKETWLAEDNPRRVYTDGGYVGDTVKHVMHNELVKYSDDVYYVFMGSGVEDDTYPSGYTMPVVGVKEQTITIKENGSNDVAFYYTKVISPEYDDILKVAMESPRAPYHLIVTKKYPSVIKLRMADKQYAYLKPVPVNDPFASPVRVKIGDGIMALQSPHIDESQFNIADDDNNKFVILYITKDIASADSTEIVTELKRLGHRVVLMKDDVIITKGYNTFDAYDLVVIGRTTTASYANILNLSGKPVILGYAVNNAKGLQVSLDFTNKSYHSEELFNPTQSVINDTHPIMLPFTFGEKFNAYKSPDNQFIGVLDGQNGRINGDALIRASNHELNPAYTMTAYTNINGHRRVYMGFLYKDFSDTTKLLLDRSIRWVMGQDHYLYENTRRDLR